MLTDIHSQIKTHKKNKFLYRLTTIAFLLLLLLALYGCEKKSTSQKAPEKPKPAAVKPEEEGFRTSRNDKKGIDINLKETKLAVIPEDYEKWGLITFSSDGRQVSYVARKKERDFITVASTAGENKGPAYEKVFLFIKSPDGRRFAFGGKKGKKKYLVVDNKEMSGLYHEEVAPAAFSPDSRFVACEVGGLKEKKWFVVVSDGEKEVYRSKVYPHTFRRPVFSPDSRLLVFELGEKTKKRIIFFLDLAAMKIIKELHYADYGYATKISFSSDSSRVLYETRKADKIYLVLHDFALNEERKVELPYASAVKFVLSPDGKKIACVANKKGEHYLVVSTWESPLKGKEYGPYEGVIPPVFSPGGTIAFHAMREGKWRTIVGDKEGASYDGVGDAPVFSRDGAKIAYAANKGGHQERTGQIGGKWFMVLELAGKPHVVKAGPGYDMVISPVFSPDGKYIAYRARTGTIKEGRRFIVIANTKTGKIIKKGPLSDEVWPPVWSADAKSAAYGARIGRELWWKAEKLDK